MSDPKLSRQNLLEHNTDHNCVTNNPYPEVCLRPTHARNPEKEVTVTNFNMVSLFDVFTSCKVCNKKVNDIETAHHILKCVVNDMDEDPPPQDPPLPAPPPSGSLNTITLSSLEKNALLLL